MRWARSATRVPLRHGLHADAEGHRLARCSSRWRKTRPAIPTGDREVSGSGSGHEDCRHRGQDVRKLAGRWVSPETLSQLTAIEESQQRCAADVPQGDGTVERRKLVLNPVGMPNIISNISMAHFAGVSMHRVDKYIGAMRDFAKKSDRILEAKEAGCSWDFE